MDTDETPAPWDPLDRRKGVKSIGNVRACARACVRSRVQRLNPNDFFYPCLEPQHNAIANSNPRRLAGSRGHTESARPPRNAPAHTEELSSNVHSGALPPT